MKLVKIGLLLVVIIFFNSCASGYKMISPNSLNYNSKDINKGVLLEYKYDLLSKKYAKNEIKKGIKVVAVKITNNSDNDIVFGKDIELIYENRKELYVVGNDEVFKSIKQNVAIYSVYLFLTSMNFYTTKNGRQTSSVPIGLIIGPGIAGGNMIAAGSANEKFNAELTTFDLDGIIIKKGETRFGLIGIKSDNYDTIKIKVK